MLESLGYSAPTTIARHLSRCLSDRDARVIDVDPTPLDEIFRLLKPGGVLACTIPEEPWESMGFKTKLDSLVGAESTRCIFLEKDRYDKNGPPEGWFCVYRKIS